MGQVTSSRFAAATTFLCTFSKSNSGVWTPTMTRPSARYRSNHERRYGIVRWQLMHEYVQKSYRTTLPESFAGVSGGESIQPSACSAGAAPYFERCLTSTGGTFTDEFAAKMTAPTATATTA